MEQVHCPMTYFQIIGEKDADGFYWGECNGVGGFVPCNMVSEVQVDDDRVLQDMVMSNKVRNS
jgi:RIMS-binding protein 2